MTTASGRSIVRWVIRHALRPWRATRARWRTMCVKAACDAPSVRRSRSIERHRIRLSLFHVSRSTTITDASPAREPVPLPETRLIILDGHLDQFLIEDLIHLSFTTHGSSFFAGFNNCARSRALKEVHHGRDADPCQ